MASNSPPDVFEDFDSRRECKLTEAAEHYCEAFLEEIADGNFNNRSSDLKCWAEKRYYGTRVIIQLFRDTKLRTQTLVRLTSMTDLPFLEQIMDGQKDALLQQVRLPSYEPAMDRPPKKKGTDQTLSQDSPPPQCDSQLQLQLESSDDD